MTDKIKSRPITEGDIAHLLRKKYSSDRGEWAFMGGVRNATGVTNITRIADAMAFNLWPSRGLEVLGFEIKTSRADWKTELAKPDKAEVIARHCDRWWIVAPTNVVQLDELPSTWGLMEVWGEEKLVVKKDAPKLEARVIPKEFWMSIMRQFSQQVDPQADESARIDQLERAAYQRGVADGKASCEAQVNVAKKNEERALEQMHAANSAREELYKLIGVSHWNLHRMPIKQAMSLLTEASHWKHTLNMMVEGGKSLLGYLAQMEEDLKKPTEPALIASESKPE